MKTLFIVNPAAGHGRGRWRWVKVEGQARALRPDMEVWWTQGAGHGRDLAQRGLARGFTEIFGVGGDGTLGEVVDGFLAAPAVLRGSACLGTWPVGSGCDLARHIKMTSEPRALLSILEAPAPRRLDAGKVGFQTPSGRCTRYFLNVAALGLAGEVGLRVQAAGKVWGGTLTYLFHTLAALASARPYPIDLTVDGCSRPRQSYHLVILANTSTTGGGMNVAPHADPQDGLLDLVTVGDLGRWDLLKRFPSIYSGGHLGKPGVGHGLLKTLEASSSETVTLNIDGEAIGTLPASFEVLPGAVPFLCPR